MNLNRNIEFLCKSVVRLKFWRIRTKSSIFTSYFTKCVQFPTRKSFAQIFDIWPRSEYRKFW